MFQAAAAGAAGINFHGGIHSPRASDDKAYTPIARMGNRYRAATLYYGMLMFAQAAPGSLIPAQLAPDTSGLKAFAVRAPDETLCVCINQNITRDERVAIEFGAKFYCRVRVAAGRTSHRCHRRGDVLHRQAAGAGRDDRGGHADEGGGSGARG